MAKITSPDGFVFDHTKQTIAYTGRGAGKSYFSVVQLYKQMMENDMGLFPRDIKGLDEFIEPCCVCGGKGTVILMGGHREFAVRCENIGDQELICERDLRMCSDLTVDGAIARWNLKTTDRETIRTVVDYLEKL